MLQTTIGALAIILLISTLYGIFATICIKGVENYRLYFLLSR